MRILILDLKWSYGIEEITAILYEELGRDAMWQSSRPLNHSSRTVQQSRDRYLTEACCLRL